MTYGVQHVQQKENININIHNRNEEYIMEIHTNGSYTKSMKSLIFLEERNPNNLQNMNMAHFCDMCERFEPHSTIDFPYNAKNIK